VLPAVVPSGDIVTPLPEDAAVLMSIADVVDVNTAAVPCCRAHVNA
jgi:hypothetical protein